HVEVGIGAQSLGHALERVGGEAVVVVHQRDVLTGGEFERPIGGGGDATGGLASRQADPRVRGGVALQRGDDLGVAGSVVEQAELPVRERLASNGGDRLLEHVRRGVVDGGEYGDQGRPGALTPGRRR